MILTADAMNRLLTVGACGLLAVAALHDVSFRTVPNTVPVALLGYGVVVHLGGGDLGLSALAAAAVFASSVLAWWAGALGGGDAKLLGAAALAVPLATVPLLLLGTALAGGVLALGFIALRPFVPTRPGRRPAVLLGRVLRAEGWRIRRRGPLPYAVAIAAGGAVSLLNG
jgi:prepilin peptidase CpaA